MTLSTENRGLAGSAGDVKRFAWWFVCDSQAPCRS
jgi:hypothetical protein